MQNKFFNVYNNDVLVLLYEEKIYFYQLCEHVIALKFFNVLFINPFVIIIYSFVLVPTHMCLT